MISDEELDGHLDLACRLLAKHGRNGTAHKARDLAESFYHHERASVAAVLANVVDEFPSLPEEIRVAAELWQSAYQR